MTDLQPFLSVLERNNLSLNSLAHAIVILYAIGVNFDYYSNLIGYPIPYLAAIYAIGIFVVDKIGSSVYPRLHPDVTCENCSSKKLHILQAKIKCMKCKHIYRVGSQAGKK
jgi:hypothetical protein